MSTTPTNFDDDFDEVDAEVTGSTKQEESTVTGSTVTDEFDDDDESGLHPAGWHDAKIISLGFVKKNVARIALYLETEHGNAGAYYLNVTPEGLDFTVRKLISAGFTGKLGELNVDSLNGVKCSVLIEYEAYNNKTQAKVKGISFGRKHDESVRIEAVDDFGMMFNQMMLSALGDPLDEKNNPIK